MAPWLQGYVRDIAGETITYHAPLPGVDTALITRCHTDWPAIEWETEPAPAVAAGGSLAICFAFGIQAGGESGRFELSLGDRSAVSFLSPGRGETTVWRFEGGDAAPDVQLALGGSLVDRHGDVMGFARLRVPASWTVPGQALRLRVAGVDAGNPCWWMTFRTNLPREPWVVPLPALVGGNEELRQPVEVHALHLGERPTLLRAWPAAQPNAVNDDGTTGDGIAAEIPFGHHSRTLFLPEVAEPTPTRIATRLGASPLEEILCERRPVRRWSLDLVQHTHTDIGYTRSQPEILAAHEQYIDQVLALCDRTDDHPDDARFRWTCEASWPLRAWLRSRSRAEREQLRRRVAEGRVELTALPLNMSEILPEELLTDFLEPLREITGEHHLPVTLAMQNDVNGIAWALADLLPSAGVDFLVMGEHGHRALVPFDKPTAFWWRGPGGGRLLAFRADHYNTGNEWGLHDGRLETVAAQLFRYLDDLEERAYPLDRAQVQFSGHFLDNAPPSARACELVRKWNERFAWPRLRLASAGEFLRWMAREHGDELPTISQAWPDWWTDGVGSAPRETLAFRRGVGAWLSARALAAAANLAGVDADAESAARAANEPARAAAGSAAAIFYAEHTYGAHDSVSAPGNAADAEQWGHKAGQAWQLGREAVLDQERTWGQMQALLRPQPRAGSAARAADAATLAVFNPCGWTRRDLVTVFVPHAMAPPGAVLAVHDGGELRAGQVESTRPEGTYWSFRCAHLPPFGLKTFGLVAQAADPAPGGEAPRISHSKFSGDAADEWPAGAEETELANEFIELRVDPSIAAVTGLIDRRQGRQWVDAAAGLGLGRLLRETVASRREMEHLRCDTAERFPVAAGHVVDRGRGPLWSWIACAGTVATPAGDARLRCEVRLLHDEPRILWRYRLWKPACLTPEAWYVAFPFAREGAELRYDHPGALIRPGRDQIPGTANDWHTVQSVVVVDHEGGQLHWSTPDVPLVQLGGLNLGRFVERAPAPAPHIYSWVANNYWVTNFRPSWAGELVWEYALAMTDHRGSAGALRAGRAAAQPLMGRLMPVTGGADAGARTAVATALAGGLDELPANLHLLSLRRTDAGVVAHLREVAGRPARIDVAAWLRRPGARAVPLDALLRHGGDPAPVVTIEPWATALLRLLPD